MPTRPEKVSTGYFGTCYIKKKNPKQPNPLIYSILCPSLIGLFNHLKKFCQKGVPGQLVTPSEGIYGTFLVLIVVIHDLKHPAVQN